MWASYVDVDDILSVQDESTIPRLSKIICTIDLNRASVEHIQAMIESGMDIARLDFSIDEPDNHIKAIENIREAVKRIRSKSETYCGVPIAVATKGPEIRIGMFEGGPEAQVNIIEGKTVRFTTNVSQMNKGTESQIFIDYEDILDVVTPGMKIYIASVILALDWVEENDMVCNVIQGGVLTSRDKVHGEGIFELKTELSPKDLSSIEMAIREKVDCLFLSCSMSQESVLKVKHMIIDCGGDMLVFAKIQNKLGLKRIKEILSAADGLVVCRHHLATEMEAEKVFSCQKIILALCKEAGKPCIFSNNLLQSMIEEPVAINADCFDIGNSVLDGVDCIVLSKPTSIGKYPLDSIRFVANVSKEAEAAVKHKRMFETVSNSNAKHVNAQSVAFTAVTSAFKANAKAIIVISTSGSTAKWMSVYHPPCPIVAITRRELESRKLRFFRALFPVYYQKPMESDWEEDMQERWKYGVECCKKMNIVEEGSVVVVVSGWKIGTSHSNTMKIITVD